MISHLQHRESQSLCRVELLDEVAEEKLVLLVGEESARSRRQAPSDPVLLEKQIEQGKDFRPRLDVGTTDWRAARHPFFAAPWVFLVEQVSEDALGVIPGDYGGALVSLAKGKRECQLEFCRGTDLVEL